MEANPSVVIDNGSSTIKAGIGGEDSPKAYFPTVVGIPRFEKMYGIDEKDFFVGNQAISKRGVLALERPVKNGVVKDWEHMRKVWHHCFYSELKIDPADQPLLITESPLNSKKSKENTMEIFFESFKVPSFYTFPQAVLALYATGLTTGVIVDSGEGTTHIAVVYDGYSIQHSVVEIDLSGKHITDYLYKHLNSGEQNGKLAVEMEVVREIKEKLCYVASDFGKEIKLYSRDKKGNEEFELPDGKKISIGDLAIKAPEGMFDPRIFDSSSGGLHTAINNTILKSDADFRRELYDNVLLAGGNTLFKGFTERLTLELNELMTGSTRATVSAPVERKFSVWIGGSVLSTLSSFQSSWVTQAEYAESGVSVLHRKLI